MIIQRSTVSVALALTALTVGTTTYFATPASAASFSVASSASATSAQLSGRPDQVFVRERRNVRPVTGVVISADLSGVVIDVGDRERRFSPDEVVRVSLNQVPDSFKEGRARAESGDFENAAAAFAAAADDSDASPVVAAVARLRAAQSLLRLTATDPGRASDAVAAAQRFVSSHPNHRDLPEARLLLGRAQLLAGDASGAANNLEALFREAQGSTVPEGYDVLTCYRAGLLAADAAVAADDAARAETLFAALDSALPGVISDLEADDPRLPELQNLRGLAQLGEGVTLLARGRSTQARSFFQTRLEVAEGATETVRAATRLGLAQSLLALEQSRQAQIEFAGVSATVFGDRDLLADALLGLAEASLAAGSGGREQARACLEQIQRELGDTLAAPAAHTLLRDL
ncbi:tetratricopeptide repeat protein [Engelhardtia mirabilis]|uniref:Tetratricopeptide repeat protein n=1 Tax=Engelhardtia mirabilis TaxID=2528011 RepID=A0A518BI70_9BACT|nr:hypothetical protein Pla133_17420 [Planctomycetes bacterium Pla133]QDV00992.1 hypothetical protein Pla86_17410 [Planctomycetes bacterium Pla86]